VSGAGPIPAGAQLVNVPLSFPVILNQTTLQASLALPISDYLLRTSKAYASASNSRSAAELTERATRKKVATDARLLFYGWVRAKYQLLVAAQALEQARQHQADVNAAVDVGSASKADALRVDSQLAAAELLLERTRNFAELFEHQLRILLHDRDEAGYSIGEDLKTPATAPEGVAQKGADGRAALIGEAIDRRLELKALDQSAKALDDLASFNRAGYFPRLDLFADVFEANPNPRIFPQREEFAATWQVGAQLSIALNDVLTARPSVSNAEARAASVRAQRALLADGLKTEVVQAHQAFGEASFAVETTKRGLTAAEESYRVRRALFQNGRATSLELTDAETDLTRARLEEINARVDLRVAIARIVHATGRDLEP
jgi:outer membrane protein TolC